MQKTSVCNPLAVPKKVLEVWKQKKSRGDVNNLIRFTGLSKPIIIKALRHGIARPELVLKISRYYSKKRMDTPDEVEQKALKILSTNP